MASMSSAVNIEMSLLNEALMAIWAVANPLLLGLSLLSRSRVVAGACRGLGVHDNISFCGVSGCQCLPGSILILFILSLNSLHKLINFSLKVNAISWVNCLVVGDSLVVSGWVGVN